MGQDDKTKQQQQKTKNPKTKQPSSLSRDLNKGTCFPSRLTWLFL